MTCDARCIYAEPGHDGPCIDPDGKEIASTGPRAFQSADTAASRDPDAPRALGSEAAPVTRWALPFACPDCKAYGYVWVVVETAHRTSDEQVTDWIGKRHRQLSTGCLRPPERMLNGRLRRWDAGQKRWIFMLKKGETEHTPIDPRWPLFDRWNSN